jgi:hypothetical protein
MKSPNELRRQGDKGESELNAWLNNNGLCYVFLSQEPNTFANLFPDAVKRPDFLVLVESVGLIAVDAKHYTQSGGVFTLELESELTRVLTFERLFRIPVWYAYKDKNKTTGETVWYWISALKALEVGKKRENKDNNTTFLAIKIEHFSALRCGEDMGLLYTQRHKSLKPLVGY